MILKGLHGVIKQFKQFVVFTMYLFIYSELSAVHPGRLRRKYNLKRKYKVNYAFSDDDAGLPAESSE